MKTEGQDEAFHFTYSAKQREEMERIREKYVPRQEDRMERLRRLDRSATRPGTIAAIVTGACGTCLLGLGMCCTMVWTAFFIPGIAVGLTGIAGVAAAMPVYNLVTKRRRERIAPEILRLADELSHS